MGCIKLDILENHYKTPELKIVHAKKELTSKKSSSERRNYYHARYYDPRTSVFLGVDPLVDKYLHVSPFTYCLNNPIILIDPDGRDTYLAIYGSGWLNPDMKGKKYDVGDGFKNNAMQLEKNIRSSGVLKKGDAVVIVYAATEKDYIEAVNKEYDSGKIKQLDVYSHGSSNSLNLGGEEGGSSDHDYRLLSAFPSRENPNGNELNQIKKDNFTDDASVTLWGCNLGTNNKYTDGTNAPSHAQALANHLGGNRQVKAFNGGGGAEFKQQNGKNVYDGTMIRSADRSTQKVNLTTYTPETQ